MKAIQVVHFGEADVLQLTDLAQPQPADDEILIKVEAIGVNPVDTYIRAGTYPALPDLPYTPGKDVAGTVVACGSPKTPFVPGHRVYTCGTASGGYAEYTTAKVSQVFRLPEGTSFQEGAALGVPATTAWRALFIRGRAKAGERLLIHGASGSVGMFAAQLARAAGLQICGTAGTPAGIEQLERLGLQQIWNHRQENYLQKIRREHGNQGFNLILEMLANVNLMHDLELLAPRGRVVVIGNRGTIQFDPRATMGKELDIRGLALQNSSGEEMRQAQAGLFAALETGVLNPVIAKVLPLAKAAEAHRQVLEDGKCGKILLQP
jgi:NADPH2:quinone reductase